MRNASALASLLLALAVLGAAQIKPAKPLSIAPEQLRRVEILYFPERILVRAALTPQRLEQLYQYKLEIRNVRDTAEWQRLLSVVRETSVKPSSEVYDYRTAVLLFNQNEQRIASVYFGQFGKGGTLNGDSGTITGGMYEWAKSLLRGVTQ